MLRKYLIANYAGVICLIQPHMDWLGARRYITLSNHRVVSQLKKKKPLLACVFSLELIDPDTE